VKYNISLQDQLQLSLAALENHVYIGNYGVFCPPPDVVIQTAKTLEIDHLYAFKKNNLKLVGSNIDKYHLQIVNNPIQHATFDIDRSIVHPEVNFRDLAYPKGYVAYGLIPRELGNNGAIDKIYILDTNGIIYDIGQIAFEQNNKNFIFWHGFVAPPTPEKKIVQLYAYVKWLNMGKLYPISQSQRILAAN
jgi:hypothetical protein